MSQAQEHHVMRVNSNKVTRGGTIRGRDADSYRKFVLDGCGRGHNGAGCVVLHHCGELGQISLEEFQGLRRLQEPGSLSQD